MLSFGIRNDIFLVERGAALLKFESAVGQYNTCFEVQSMQSLDYDLLGNVSTNTAIILDTTAQ